MKSPVFPGKAFVFDGLFADSAIVGCAYYVTFGCSFPCLLGFQPVVQLTNVFEKVGQAFLTADLAFELERTLETDANEELEIMCEAGNKRQEFLGNAESSNTGLL